MKEYENVDLKSSQREALFLQCFQYYVMKEDNTAATKYYNLIKENNQSGDHSELDITYDVFVKKGYDKSPKNKTQNKRIKYFFILFSLTVLKIV